MAGSILSRALAERISSIANKLKNKEPFFVFDSAAVSALRYRWNDHLGEHIEPYHAVKCNPEPAFLRTMAALGAGFDCVSRAEAEAVMSLGVPASRILYANPCKAESHLRFAAETGINISTFNSAQEVAKIQKTHPRCELFLRIKPPDKGDAVYLLEEEITPLLGAARAAGSAVVGVSFHVGSAVRRPSAYRASVAAARAAFDAAERVGFPRLRVLGIGGGFVSAGEQFEESASVIKLAIRDYFSDISDLKVIAEHGRFFAESAFSLVTNVIGKRVMKEQREYWLNDGIYWSMSGAVHDGAELVAAPLVAGENGNKMFASTVFGPTCDGKYTVLKDFELPELAVGDWLVFPNMGAYAAASTSCSNGVSPYAISTHLL